MTDAQLIEAFENLTLPFEQWTHRAHTKIAYCYLQAYSFEEALKKLRAGIRAYNAHHNVPEGPTSGYNETTGMPRSQRAVPTPNVHSDSRSC